jgi:hypothetical protein
MLDVTYSEKKKPWAGYQNCSCVTEFDEKYHPIEDTSEMGTPS